MNPLYQALRYLVLPSILTASLLGLIHYYQGYWSAWSETLALLPYWLLGISSCVALQFNRSRLSYIGILLLLFYAISQGQWLSHERLASLSDSLLLSGAFIITLFSFIKDRGVLSAHGLLRLGLILVCFAAAFAWLRLPQAYPLQVSELVQRLPLPLSMSGLPLLPLYPVTALLLMRISWQSNLLHTCLGMTFALWLMHFIQPQWLPLSVSLCATAFLYLLTILIDSYFLAYRDELTSLPSRRALYNLSLSLGRKYTLAMVDIDHFKKFNDTYGHDVGDQVLKLVAAKLAKVSGGGRVFRYGGEEFTIVFPRKDAERVWQDLNEVRENVEQYRIVLRDNKRKAGSKKQRSKSSSDKRRHVSVTISIGAAQHKAGESFDQSLKRADNALYKAKKAGRNQVCL